jgi:hypothetical protein
MKSLDKLNKLADRFENKLYKIAQESSQEQVGTVELFFDSDTNMIAFGDTIRRPEGPIFKILNDYAMKTGKSCSFDLKVSAEPNQKASWILAVQPSSLKATIASTIDKEFRKIMGVGMVDRQKVADAGVKKGSGNGTLDVGSLALDM